MGSNFWQGQPGLHTQGAPRFIGFSAEASTLQLCCHSVKAVCCHRATQVALICYLTSWASLSLSSIPKTEMVRSTALSKTGRLNHAITRNIAQAHSASFPRNPECTGLGRGALTSASTQVAVHTALTTRRPVIRQWGCVLLNWVAQPMWD